MDLSSINELDFNESGEWPTPIKLVALLLVVLVVFGAGYYFIIKDQKTRLSQLEAQEQQLRTEFETKSGMAVNLDAYKEQMKEMEIAFASMLQQLPGRSEVADLLTDISRTGINNGLEFELFRPESERTIDFYVELPISMRVTGTYHQFASFMSDLAALPRIVSMHDLRMGPLGSDGKMSMDITAKTYRYQDESSR
ncbi:MAG: type 4a pilus biogenesis protein PilO [Methylophaga sp.]|nr:type 4a pilus biogenesis protein PilO [Methylophaga sp.]